MRCAPGIDEGASTVYHRHTLDIVISPWVDHAAGVQSVAVAGDIMTQRAGLVITGFTLALAALAPVSVSGHRSECVSGHPWRPVNSRNDRYAAKQPRSRRVTPARAPPDPRRRSVPSDASRPIGGNGFAWPAATAPRRSGALPPAPNTRSREATSPPSDTSAIDRARERQKSRFMLVSHSLSGPNIDSNVTNTQEERANAGIHR